MSQLRLKVNNHKHEKSQKTYLDHVGFVSFQNLDSLGCLWINDENTRVTSLSYQSLPTPTEHERQMERENTEKNR